MAWRLLVAVALLLAGCATSELEATDVGPSQGRGRPVVVAVLDGGVNPYHDAFTTAPSEGADTVAALTAAREVRLSGAGTLPERLENDDGLLRSVQRGELVRFAGTPLLGITFATDQEDDPPFMEAGVGHGTPIASVLLRDAPGIVVVIVQIQTVICYVGDLPTRCAEFPALVEGMEWIAAQDWIDVVSLSLGLPANAPDPRDEAKDFARATRAAADNGMLVVGAAGNDPVPAWPGFTAGPPWVVSVGGWEEDPAGLGSLDKSRAPDVIANSTTRVARADSIDESTDHAGTSFASPVVSATFARAIQLLRGEPATPFEQWKPIGTSAPSDAQPLDAARLRAALNASATIVTLPVGDPALGLDAAVSYIQGGWGRIDAGHADVIAQRIRDGQLDVPEEKRHIAEHQARGMSVRHVFWDSTAHGEQA